MKKLSLVVLIGFAAALLAGCETIKGAGQDLQNTGDNIWGAVTQKKGS